MTDVDASILRDMVGPQTTGPAGFGIHYNVEDNADIDIGTNTITAKLDEKSLSAAHFRNEGKGLDKFIGSLTPDKNNKSAAVGRDEQRREQGDQRYAALLVKRDLLSSTTKAMTPQFGGRRADHRSALATSVATNPLLRVRQRHLLRLRQTFNQIAARKTKTVAINPENLPAPTIEKMVTKALETGVNMTPVGTVAKAAKLAGMQINPWKKWQHALIDGSYPEFAPTPRR